VHGADIIGGEMVVKEFVSVAELSDVSMSGIPAIVAKCVAESIRQVLEGGELDLPLIITVERDPFVKTGSGTVSMIRTTIKAKE
jgi:hypothetical protein